MSLLLDFFFVLTVLPPSIHTYFVPMFLFLFRVVWPWVGLLNAFSREEGTVVSMYFLFVVTTYQRSAKKETWEMGPG